MPTILYTSILYWSKLYIAQFWAESNSGLKIEIEMETGGPAQCYIADFAETSGCRSIDLDLRFTVMV